MAFDAADRLRDLVAAGQEIPSRSTSRRRLAPLPLQPRPSASSTPTPASCAARLLRRAFTAIEIAGLATSCLSG